jgi:hypothetical protein
VKVNVYVGAGVGVGVGTGVTLIDGVLLIDIDGVVLTEGVSLTLIDGVILGVMLGEGVGVGGQNVCPVVVIAY